MTTDKKHIRQLASLMIQKGIRNIVISPGSRNAPLINQFTGTPEFSCMNVVDERSAAYVALGIALAKKEPVAIVCTSGTAAINYGPAIAESFYQKIPLLVLTADRPKRWVDQADGQTVRQENLFANHSLKSISLTEAEGEDDFRHNNIRINEVLNQLFSGIAGPVHINIPMNEPLYGMTDELLPHFRNIEVSRPITEIAAPEMERLISRWNQTKKKMIIAGQLSPDEKINHALRVLTEDPGTVLLAEHLTNLTVPMQIPSTDIALASVPSSGSEAFRPEILITFGEQIVSKRLKQFIRNNPPREHWHISAASEHTDTYNSLTRVIPCQASLFLNKFCTQSHITESDFQEIWHALYTRAVQLQEKYLSDAAFCDLTACRLIARHLPEQSVIHLGNSSAVRLMQMFEPQTGCEYYGNRGTSGIDGSSSTAAGFALHSGKINTLITGELAFFYDSNALWNSPFPQNLRMIVLNNGGGNIFRLIGGPSKSPALNEHFVARHTLKAEGLARSFGFNYQKANTADELSKALKTIFAPEITGPAILEIFTDGELSAEIFKQCYSLFRN